MSNLASRRHWHETKSFWTILLTCEWPKFGWQNLKTAKCKSPNYFEEISCQNLICQARTSYNTKRSKLRKDSRKRGLCTSPHPRAKVSKHVTNLKSWRWENWSFACYLYNVHSWFRSSYGSRGRPSPSHPHVRFLPSVVFQFEHLSAALLSFPRGRRPPGQFF